MHSYTPRPPPSFLTFPFFSPFFFSLPRHLLPLWLEASRSSLTEFERVIRQAHCTLQRLLAYSTSQKLLYPTPTATKT
jgi:hypothetical protein